MSSIDEFLKSGIPPVPIPSLEEVGVKINGPTEDLPPDLIPGLVPRGGQLVIVGETNVGKSLLSLEIISAFSTGSPLWGDPALTPVYQAKKIVYFLGEHYNGVIQRMWQKTQLPLGDEVWLIGPEALQGNKWLVNKGSANLQAVDHLSRWADGADMIVFDPLAAFGIGQDIENDNNLMRLVMDQMSLVSQNTGASCIILGHQGKPLQDAKGNEIARKKYATRGASSTEDAATNIFYLGEAILPESQAKEGWRAFSLKLRKYKGEAPDEYKLIRDPDTLTHKHVTAEGVVDTKRLGMEVIYSRISRRYPDLTGEEILQLVACVKAVDVETVKRILA